MFVDEDLEGAEFKSSWKRTRETDEIGTQTKPLKSEDVGCQSIKYYDEETQTENGGIDFIEFAETNMERLNDFLRKLEPELIKLIEKNNNSVAFVDYIIRSEEETSPLTCVHVLSHSELRQDLHITSTSWNSTGSVLAAAYGRYDHEDWCTHKSAICTWSLDRRHIDPDKPTSTIDSSCCVMCVEFHPTNPALIAAGNFNGEVFVYDLSQEDDMLLASSGIGDDAHREPVASLYWHLDTSSKHKRYNLISVGGDGKILIWTISKKKSKLKLLDGFVLMMQSLPRNLKSRNIRGDKEVGGTSISFNCEDKDNFIVGSESGCIFKCSLMSQGTPAGSHIKSSVPLRSPVTFTFNPHHGPVYSVDYSPFHRNAFLTSGMDQCIRVYNVLQDQAIMMVDPGDGYVFNVKWSPVRPTVLAAVTEKGNLLIYDLKSGQSIPLYKIQASSSSDIPVYNLQFNNKKHHLLATGDGAGYVRVFKLGDDMSQPAFRDIEHLATTIATSAD